MNESQLKIIIVEDDAGHAEAICRSFEPVVPKVDIQVASSLAAYRTLLAGTRPDLVFMDMNLPDGSALEALTAPAEDGAFPIVIMTSYGNEALAVKCMKAGAIDYLVKSADTFDAMPLNAMRALRGWQLLQERRRCEIVLHDQDAELAAIYDHAPLIMLLVDQDRKVVKVNTQAVTFIGSKAVDLLGKRQGEAIGCIHSLDDPAGCGFGPSCSTCLTRHLVIDAFNGQNHYQEEANLQLTLRGEKKIIPVLLSTTMIILSRPLVLLSIMDVSKLKVAEDALRVQKERYQKISLENQALLDAIPDRITMVSPEMKVVWINKATAQALQKEPAEIIGQSCYALWHNRTEVCESCPVRQCFQTGKMAQKNTSSLTSGLTMDVMAVPVLEDGRVVSVIEVARDITESLKMAERIRQSQKMEAIGVLAGGIAHDFNNILGVILGYTEIARDDAPPQFALGE